MQDWQELARITQGAEIVVERVRLAERDIAIEGAFALPQLARLGADDQVFVAAFLKESPARSRRWSRSSASPIPR